MKVYYDKDDNNQVQAIYTEDSSSATWNDFSCATVRDPTLCAQLLKSKRDCRVIVNEYGDVTGIITHDHPVDHSLEKEIRRRCARIDNQTKQLIDKGFEYQGNRFSLTASAQLKLMGLMLAAGVLPYPVCVSTMEESEFVLDRESDLRSWGYAGLCRMLYHLRSGTELKHRCVSSRSKEDLVVVDDRRGRA